MSGGLWPPVMLGYHRDMAESPRPEPSLPSQPPLPAEQPAVLALVRDLMFSGRVTGTARDMGVRVKVIRDPAALGGVPGRRLIVDLNLDGAIEAAANWKREGRGEVIGFVSHVDTATINRARAAGVGRVIARSQFVQVLPDLLRDEAPPEPTTTAEGT